MDLKYAFLKLFENCLNTPVAYTRKDYIELKTKHERIYGK